MMLTGKEIARQVRLGGIVIDPFDPTKVGPNSYDLRLADELVVYDLTDGEHLDVRRDNPSSSMQIPEEGLVLQPGRLYLGRTVEYTETHPPFVPRLDGRSSIGRLGICVHLTAALGDIGFCGCFTLEMTCVHPIRIYSFVKVAQITYYRAEGEITLYAGKYQGDRKATPSRLHQDPSSEYGRSDR